MFHSKYYNIKYYIIIQYIITIIIKIENILQFNPFTESAFSNGSFFNYIITVSSINKFNIMSSDINHLNECHKFHN